MTRELLEELREITAEEKRILSGSAEIEKGIYMSPESNVVDAGKLLDAGKLIQVRPHTRFVHFPAHTHNYIEVIYMCAGSTHHVIDGHDVYLHEGELLFLNQQAVQEIYPAGEGDIAVNFIILPEFFDYTLKLMEEEQNLLRDFVVDCLTGKNQASGYLHFKVGDVLPVRNLLENLIWTIRNKQPNKRSINQITMGLLFLQLLNHGERVETAKGNPQQRLMMDVLTYIEEHYRDGEFAKLAEYLHYDVYWLSREIKKLSGKNYTELLQEKRLNQAAYLLEHTGMPVLDIGLAVGYENMSYFHRIFQKRFGVTPRNYRVNKGTATNS
ncbi:MAG: helix-turn-helix domain-containing protein [Lachnospiraceae bacterium]|nr:helix-turn-helix domain-containing protein [Lachnospiraceae bacterium]